MLLIICVKEFILVVIMIILNTYAITNSITTTFIYTITIFAIIVIYWYSWTTYTRLI